MSFIAPQETRFGNCTIRSYRSGDGPALSAAIVASYEHLRTFMPWATREYPPAEGETLARRFAARYLQNEEFVLGIFDGPEVVGGTGFHLREGPLESRCAEIGMWIAGGRAGRGLGTEALRAMLRWGFDDWAWLRLSWHCDSRNLASARVAVKAGLTLEGTLRGQWCPVTNGRRDTLVYAALSGEWSESQRAG